MESIALLLPDLDITEVRPKIKNERQYIISLFVDKLNNERGTLKPLTPSFIAFKMSHLKKDDLYFFLKQCEKGDSFSKVWWGALKTVDRPLARFKKRLYN